MPGLASSTWFGGRLAQSIAFFNTPETESFEILWKCFYLLMQMLHAKSRNPLLCQILLMQSELVALTEVLSNRTKFLDIGEKWETD